MSHSISTKATAAIVINESDKLNSYLFPTMTRLICRPRNRFTTKEEDPVYHIFMCWARRRDSLERRRCRKEKKVVLIVLLNSSFLLLASDHRKQNVSLRW